MGRSPVFACLFLRPFRMALATGTSLASAYGKNLSGPLLLYANSKSAYAVKDNVCALRKRLYLIDVLATSVDDLQGESGLENLALLFICGEDGDVKGVRTGMFEEASKYGSPNVPYRLS